MLAIRDAVDGNRSQVPMTQDLLRNVIDRLAAKLRAVVVTELRDGCFFAELELSAGRGDIASPGPTV